MMIVRVQGEADGPAEFTADKVELDARGYITLSSEGRAFAWLNAASLMGVTIEQAHPGEGRELQQPALPGCAPKF